MFNRALNSNGYCKYPFEFVTTAYSIASSNEIRLIPFIGSQGTGLSLEGRHNADMGWISELRRSGDAWV